VYNSWSGRPFTGSQYPAGDDPQWQHEYDEYGAGADRHQSLQNKSRVQLYPVQRSDTSRRRVREEPAVEQQDSADEIEPEEHW